MATSKAAGAKPLENDRVTRSKDAVLGAAYAMMSEAGLSGFSIDAVSRKSGVAKMTIYRHWPSRAALLLDACSRMSPRAEIPDTGKFAGDIRQLALLLAESMQTGRWAQLLPSIIDAAERDRELAALHARQHVAMTTAFRTIIERAKTKKQLAAAVDTTTLIALIMGPLVYRRWFSRETIDDSFVDAIVKNAILLAARKRPRPA